MLARSIFRSEMFISMTITLFNWIFTLQNTLSSLLACEAILKAICLTISVWMWPTICSSFLLPTYLLSYLVCSFLPRRVLTVHCRASLPRLNQQPILIITCLPSAPLSCLLAEPCCCFATIPGQIVETLSMYSFLRVHSAAFNLFIHISTADIDCWLRAVKSTKVLN